MVLISVLSDCLKTILNAERAGKRHAVITGVVEGGDDVVAAEIG